MVRVASSQLQGRVDNRDETAILAYRRCSVHQAKDEDHASTRAQIIFAAEDSGSLDVNIHLQASCSFVDQGGSDITVPAGPNGYRFLDA